MKLFALVCAYFCLSSPALAATVESVFIPKGFDDNDNVQIVLKGTLPSTCWKISGVSVVKESDYSFSVEPVSSQANRVCMPVSIPFYRVVDLGTLNSGEYLVRTGNQKMPYTLSVAKSTSGEKDELLYANIVSGYVKDKTLNLKGIHPDATFTLDSAKVSVQDNVVEILPVAHSSRENGIFVTIPFEMQVDLSKMVEEGETYLIHVRSLNGNSLNLVESF